MESFNTTQAELLTLSIDDPFYIRKIEAARVQLKRIDLKRFIDWNIEESIKVMLNTFSEKYG